MKRGWISLILILVIHISFFVRAAEPTYDSATQSLIDNENFDSYTTICTSGTKLSDKYNGTDGAKFLYLESRGQEWRNRWDPQHESNGIIALVTGYGGSGNAVRMVYGGVDGLEDGLWGTTAKLDTIGELGGGLPEVAGPYTHIYWSTRFRFSNGANPSEGCSSSTKGFMFYFDPSLSSRWEFRPTTQIGGQNCCNNAQRWNWGGGTAANNVTNHNWWKTSDGQAPIFTQGDGNWHNITF